jgi:ElaB/YqjD/DUF883 family membrane-anchored ribosome-binding protein
MSPACAVGLFIIQEQFMGNKSNLREAEQSAKKLWRTASREIEPLKESALEIAGDSVRYARRAAKNTTRFVRKNPWTTAFAVAALVAAGVAALIIGRQKPAESEAT